MKEYAVYKGDTFIDIGTVKELAGKLKVDEKTIRFWATATYRRRLEKRQSENALIAIRLD